jgi:hypothetical protein
MGFPGLAVGEAHTTVRRWYAARDAAAAVPGWLAFRYLFGREHNGFEPVGPIQLATRQRARDLAAEIVAALGGQLMAPPPPGLDDDPAWAAYLEAATMLEPGQRRMLMVWLMLPLQTDQASRQLWDDKGIQLRLLVHDMRRQGRGNRKPKRKGRRRKRK